MVREGFLEEEVEELGGQIQGRRGTRASFNSTPLVPQVRIAKQLTLGRTVDPKDVAILTPYNAQAAEISKSLGREGVTGVTVCSITKSQGECGSGAGGSWASSHRVGAGGMAGASSCLPNCAGSEWRYVLVSTVRTCQESDLDQRPTKSWLKKFLGFVVDPNQVNVAITRAKEGLCFIGRTARLGVGRGGRGSSWGVWLLVWGWGGLGRGFSWGCGCSAGGGEGFGRAEVYYGLLSPPSISAGDHRLLRCCPLWRRFLDFCEDQQTLVPASQVRVRRRPAVSP